MTSGMHNRAEAALHLRELLGLCRVLDQPAVTNHLAVDAVVRDKGLVFALEPRPGRLGHARVEGLAEFQAHFLGQALLGEEVLEGGEMGHLVLDEGQGAVGAEAAGPFCVS